MAEIPTPVNPVNLSNQTITPQSFSPTGKLAKLLNEKKSGRDFQARKHQDWNENYELYRNKVRTNRLTQRQVVNVPLMKETIKTILAGSDDAPDVQWQEKSGDQMKEIIYQEIWNKNFKDEGLETKDLLDKKNVYLYGLSTKLLNLEDDGVCISIEDPFNVIYDPLMNPMDIETARFIVHQNIFRPLRDILVDSRYTDAGKEQLKRWLATDRGMIQSAKNKIEYEKSIERLKAMGVQNENFGVFAGGDVMVNLTQHFTQLWDPAAKTFKRHVVVYADDTIELMDDLLFDLIGMDEWPMDVWYEDPEGNDPYPDGIADLVRTPNKILNIWFSQQVENRTLQNFQMHWFDATVQGYQPQTYEPGPGRMLPAPGDPNKTIMPVAINGLDETMKAMDYLIQMVERGTGATAIEKGVQDTNDRTTLGEVQILAGKATERAKTMSKFYKASWYRVAKKWDKMMQANASSFPKMTLFKTGIDGKVYQKVVYPADWKSEAGYEPTVESSSEQESDDIKMIQKFGYVIAQNPNNKALKRIAQRRQLKVLDLTAPELKEVEDEEMKLQQQEAIAAATPATPAAPAAPAGNGAPTAPATPPTAAAPQQNDSQDVLSMLHQLAV